MTPEQFDAEMTRAGQALTLARFRIEQYVRAFGQGRVETDLRARLRAALARVRYLETLAAARAL